MPFEQLCSVSHHNSIPRQTQAQDVLKEQLELMASLRMQGGPSKQTEGTSMTQSLHTAAASGDFLLAVVLLLLTMSLV